MYGKFNFQPTIWNQLCITIKYSETIDTIHKKLKTYLFEISFPPSFFFDGSMLQRQLLPVPVYD